MKPLLPPVVAVAVLGFVALLTGCSEANIAPATSEKPESAAQIPAKRATDPRAMPTTIRLWLT